MYYLQLQVTLTAPEGYCKPRAFLLAGALRPSVRQDSLRSKGGLHCITQAARRVQFKRGGSRNLVAARENGAFEAQLDGFTNPCLGARHRTHLSRQTQFAKDHPTALQGFIAKTADQGEGHGKVGGRFVDFDPPAIFTKTS